MRPGAIVGLVLPRIRAPVRKPVGWRFLCPICRWSWVPLGGVLAEVDGPHQHKLATAFGRPLQYSVFACLLRREDRVRLAARIESVIDSRSDRVIILDMGTVTDRESWIPPMQIFGCQETIQERSALIV